MPESSTVAPQVVPSPMIVDSAYVVASNLKEQGYKLGHVYPIASNDNFDMLDVIPGPLMSMTHIICCCLKAPPFFLHNLFTPCVVSSLQISTNHTVIDQNDENSMILLLFLLFFHNAFSYNVV